MRAGRQALGNTGHLSVPKEMHQPCRLLLLERFQLYRTLCVHSAISPARASESEPYTARCEATNIECSAVTMYIYMIGLLCS